MSAEYDWVIIGAGPAGQKAAIQAAKVGQRVLMVEREPLAGGACVRRGTIPSKTLRETAMAISAFRRRSGNVFDLRMPEEIQVESLMLRKRDVIDAHEKFMTEQLERNGVERRQGRAKFVSSHELSIVTPTGEMDRVRAKYVVIATGSRPRQPPEIAIDHENILDSDSILSLLYLPRTLTVLGAGVIATEYASIFSALGVVVSMVDKNPRPVGFMDDELTDRFVESFEQTGSKFHHSCTVDTVRWDGISAVETTLTNGQVLTSDKLLCALGRVANVEGLAVENAGVYLTSRGLIEVDGSCQTKTKGVYAVGDVIGAPALASTAMEQGRRAVCHALALGSGGAPEHIPMGVYAVPEMSSVGLTEAQAVERYGGATVGRANFCEVARGQIAAISDGMLKLVATPDARKIVGVHIVGESAAELVHVGQMALIGGLGVSALVENIFNFPTLAEAYRVAALDLLGRHRRSVCTAA